ncbi:MAG: NAD(P)/FAD-dependent oxidoreductase, partial [Halocynthiibacter sp.]
MTERESLSFDVVIVGAGPAGLAAAIRLCQLGNAAGERLNVCVVEKGAEVGAHLLSGALLDPRALAELFSDWRTRGAPLEAPVSEERLVLLTRRGHWSLPTLRQMSNAGNQIVSLGRLCQWLAREAEALGVQIFPGFAAAEVLFDAQNAVRGVRTGDMGLNRQGEPADAYAPGVDLHAPFTLLAEGCRGSLSGQVVRH